MFRLACGDVMPGCAARFEHTDRDLLLGLVAEHAELDHQITEMTLDVRRAVLGHIRVVP